MEADLTGAEKLLLSIQWVAFFMGSWFGPLFLLHVIKRDP